MWSKYIPLFSSLQTFDWKFCVLLVWHCFSWKSCQLSQSTSGLPLLKDRSEGRLVFKQLCSFWSGHDKDQGCSHTNQGPQVGLTPLGDLPQHLPRASAAQASTCLHGCLHVCLPYTPLSFLRNPVLILWLIFSELRSLCQNKSLGHPSLWRK